MSSRQIHPEHSRRARPELGNSPGRESQRIRESFLRFFEKQGHKRLPSAPLVPPGDPTLLFTSAGMVQFKPYFLGQAKPPHPRLTTVQKCFRTSDIDSVGDASHLTFFEMLGNFSIGDYFKAEAIPWAWEYVTSARSGLGLTPERLWAAVYLDDDEAFDLWRAVGVPAERIMRYGEESNYWFAGEVGPCGPCSELHYDFGPTPGCAECAAGACHPEVECGRFLEIWNLVFMTYFCDGQKREPLPARNIDTGAGLERLAVVKLFESDTWPDKSQRPSVYDTDLFRPIIGCIEEISGKRYGEDEKTDRAMRIVAEHARAVTFLIGDERTPVLPSNEERGYVVRRILRRAVYFGRAHLGLEQPFLSEVADAVIQHLSLVYPELERQRDFVLRTIEPEERRFEETLSRGLELLNGQLIPAHEKASKIIQDLAAARIASDQAYLNLINLTILTGPIQRENIPHWLVGQALQPLTDALKERSNETSLPQITTLASQIGTILSGREAFVLHDTYGFPLELTAEIARERGFTVDEAGFQEEMEKQRQRARAAARGGEAVAAAQAYASLDVETAFVGYETLEARTRVVGLLSVGAQGLAPLQDIEGQVEAEILLAQTPFYPEGGGQVGDRGEIIGHGGRFLVEDTQRVAERLIVHRGRVVEGRIAVGDSVTARVDPQHREDTMRNHTGTHLLHAALRQVLGPHVRQAGSLVAPDRLRFDFTHTEALTPQQLAQVQALVNQKVRQNVEVHSRQTSFDQAMSEGILAFFGEKYGEEVRVVEVNGLPAGQAGDSARFSAELCGGTHCHRTGDIGTLLIVGESSIGSGVRRIEALTGRGAEEYVRQQLSAADEMAQRLGTPREALAAKLDSLLAEMDAQRKRIERLERSLASAPSTGQLLEQAAEVDGLRVLAARVDVPSQEALRYLGDAVRGQLGSGVAVLAAVIDDRPFFLALVTRDQTARVHAGQLLKEVAAITGGSGGGRPDLAQGGGKDASRLEEALARVPQLVQQALARS